MGRIVELDVGPVANGGHCVARLDGRVVFVRHALPGERVRARLTAGGADSRFLRADAVEILQASPDRVEAPCPSAGPGRCGGCDWQHATPEASRRLKAAVVREQLARLARLELAVEVEALPGDTGGLGWRTRVQHAVDAQGQLGYHRHRSHELVAVSQCPISHPRVVATGHLDQHWGRCRSVEVVAPARGEDRLVIVEQVSPTAPPPRVPADASVSVITPEGLQRVRGRTWVRELVTVGSWTREFRVTGSGFWQVHPGAPAALVGAVLDQLSPQRGESALDLYAGVGLFAAALAERVGPAGRVQAVESDARAVADARRNLHDLSWLELRRGAVADALTELAAQPDGADVVVLDPPRAGAGRTVMEQLCRMRPRAISYVACEPSALARDVAIAAEHGYRLDALRAFDAFPMTHHVECVALLRPAP